MKKKKPSNQATIPTKNESNKGDSKGNLPSKDLESELLEAKERIKVLEVEKKILERDVKKHLAEIKRINEVSDFFSDLNSKDWVEVEIFLNELTALYKPSKTINSRLTKKEKEIIKAESRRVEQEKILNEREKVRIEKEILDPKMKEEAYKKLSLNPDPEYVNAVKIMSERLMNLPEAVNDRAKNEEAYKKMSQGNLKRRLEGLREVIYKSLELEKSREAGSQKPRNKKSPKKDQVIKMVKSGKIDPMSSLDSIHYAIDSAIGEGKISRDTIQRALPAIRKKK
jgi:hypothetical protein